MADVTAGAKQMNDVISVSGLKLWGYHGVHDHEKNTGQWFLIDLFVEVDTNQAAASDDVLQTLNYSQLIDRVAEVVTGEAVDLIETLAAQIMQVIWEFPGALQATVSVHKPGAPVKHPVSDIAVTITRHRPELSP